MCEEMSVCVKRCQLIVCFATRLRTLISYYCAMCVATYPLVLQVISMVTWTGALLAGPCVWSISIAPQ